MANLTSAYRSEIKPDTDREEIPHGGSPAVRYWIKIAGEALIGFLLIAIGLLSNAVHH